MGRPSVQIIVLLDGREFVSEPVRPEPASVRGFAASFNANLPQLMSFQMMLADGSAIALPKETIQRALFLFRETAPTPPPQTIRVN